MGQKKSRVTPARIAPQSQPENPRTTQSRVESTHTPESRGQSTHRTTPPPDSNTNAAPRVESSTRSSSHFSLSDELARELSEENNISQEELEFLWQQFNKYSLTSDNLIQCDTTEFSDPFTKNVFKRILRVEGKPNNIEFASFVHYLSKWSNSNGLAKSQLLFQIIYNGDPISKILLSKLVSLVYPELTQTEKEEKADTIVKVMDTKNSGVVDQEDFIEYFSRQDARAAINIGIKLELTNTNNQ